MKYDSVKVEINKNEKTVANRWTAAPDREIRTRREAYSMMSPTMAATVSENSLRFKLYSEELTDATALLGEINSALQKVFQDSLDKDDVVNLTNKVTQARRMIESVNKEIRRFT